MLSSDEDKIHRFVDAFMRTPQEDRNWFELLLAKAWEGNDYKQDLLIKKVDGEAFSVSLSRPEDQYKALKLLGLCDLLYNKPQHFFVYAEHLEPLSMALAEAHEKEEKKARVQKTEPPKAQEDKKLKLPNVRWNYPEARGLVSTLVHMGDVSYKEALVDLVQLLKRVDAREETGFVHLKVTDLTPVHAGGGDDGKEKPVLAGSMQHIIEELMARQLVIRDEKKDEYLFPKSVVGVLTTGIKLVPEGEKVKPEVNSRALIGVHLPGQYGSDKVWSNEWSR